MKIAKWETFQGYQKTGPKWIKLHAGLIDKPEWMRLPLVAKAVLPMLWIAASRAGSTGELPEEPAMLSMLCHMKESEVLEALPSLISFGFIECEGFIAEPAKVLSHHVREESRPRERERREREQTETPVQPPSSPSVDSQPDADAARSDLREALQDLRRRYHAFAEKPDQAILDCPVFHAPTGPVRIDHCANVALMRATAGKVRAYGQPKPTKARKTGVPGWDRPDDAQATIEQRAKEWLAPFVPPISVLELRAIASGAPEDIREAVTMILFARNPQLREAPAQTRQEATA